MSEADSGWFLRHRDGVEHGPFRLADLVAAATAGNVATDTVVRHEIHTQGQWIFAPRLQPISAAMPAAASTPPAAAAAKNVAAAASTTAASTASTSPAGAATGGAVPARSSANASASQPPASNQPAAVPSIRSLRERAFPVPKTFLDATAAMFDFRFRYFITPWIIKILWVICIAVAILWILMLGSALFVEPSIETAPAATNTWQFEPLAGQSIFQTRAFAFMMATAFTIVMLLCARVVMEGAIVIFYLARDIREMKIAMKERRE